MISTVVIVVLSFVFLTSSVSGAVFLMNGSDVTGNDTFEKIISDVNSTSGTYSIVFFYNTHCGACHVAMTYLNEYNAANPDITINSYDLFNSSDNKILFEQYKAAYHRSYVSVPSVFMGNIGLEGESAIREHFAPLVAWYEKDRNTTANQTDDQASKAGIKAHRKVISIPLVLIAGIVDGINPCACAVLIFLLICLMTIRQRIRVLLAGFVFSSAVFFFYFLSGTGLINFLKTPGVLYVSSLIAGIIAIIAGVLVIKKAFLPDIGPKLIPDPIGERVAQGIESLTVLIAFILGFIIGIFELPCSGGIYVAILDMISFRVHMEQGLVYLTLYNLAFIIPLLIITGLVYWAMPPEQVNEFEPGQQRALRLFIGLLLFVFAFLIVTGVM